MTNGANNHVDYTYGEKGKPFSMIYDGAEYFYIYNLQGDILGLLDANGTQVVSYSYNSCVVKTNSKGTAAKVEPTSGAIGGILKGIASNLLNLFR